MHVGPIPDFRPLKLILTFFVSSSIVHHLDSRELDPSTAGHALDDYTPTNITKDRPLARITRPSMASISPVVSLLLGLALLSLFITYTSTPWSTIWALSIMMFVTQVWFALLVHLGAKRRAAEQTPAGQ